MEYLQLSKLNYGRYITYIHATVKFSYDSNVYGGNHNGVADEYLLW